ncbi:MAG: tripartite tricarboxylate transporter TctB family protein [Succinivibrio sp.]
MRIHDFLLGLLIIAVSAAIYFTALSFPDQNDGKPGAWLFPCALSILFGICGLCLAIKGLLHFREQKLVSLIPGLSGPGALRIAAVLAFVIFYILVSDSLGFLITMCIVIFAMMEMMRNKLWVSLLAAPLSTAAIYLIFAKLLQVPLPEGLFSF